jgi:hypothetical protein
MTQQHEEKEALHLTHFALNGWAWVETATSQVVSRQFRTEEEARKWAR